MFTKITSFFASLQAYLWAILLALLLFMASGWGISQCRAKNEARTDLAICQRDKQLLITERSGATQFANQSATKTKLDNAKADSTIAAMPPAVRRDYVRRKLAEIDSLEAGPPDRR